MQKFKADHNCKFKKVLLICFILTGTTIIYYGFLCSNHLCLFPANNSDVQKRPFVLSEEQRDFVEENTLNQNDIVGHRTAGISYRDIFSDSFHFDINAHDVMVFLHIQKTGGTSFGRHLVQDLDLQRPCTCQRKRKRCYCFRPNRNENWLFSRYSTGWKCGLHADWTELTNCVDQELTKNEGELDKRRYYYVTLLREPISRYFSEFKHVQRGATWRKSRHRCGGHLATSDELPRCYSGPYWKNVSLEDFLQCPYNLAHNRQTRMLSDLSLVGCYNQSSMNPNERNRVMLASAKRNLVSMSFFGLTEFQKISQYIFEETFNLRFAVPFGQINITKSGSYISNLKPWLLKKVKDMNALDLELYKFAKTILFRRFQNLRNKDPDFEKRWKHLGELPVKSEFNWDKEIEDNEEYTQD